MRTITAPARPLFTTATGVQISLRHVLSQITGTPARDRASDVRQGRVTASTAEDFACLVIDAIESAERLTDLVAEDVPVVQLYEGLPSLGPLYDQATSPRWSRAPSASRNSQGIASRGSAT